MTTSKTIADLTERLAAAEAEITRLREESEHATAYRFGNWYAVNSTCVCGHWDVEFESDESHTVTFESKAEAITEARRLAGVK